MSRNYPLAFLAPTFVGGGLLVAGMAMAIFLYSLVAVASDDRDTRESVKR
jgi:hypothetical protein